MSTLVTEENFIEAETDRYFSEHVRDHPVNTIRHARDPSGPNNQFVIDPASHVATTNELGGSDYA